MHRGIGEHRHIHPVNLGASMYNLCSHIHPDNLGASTYNLSIDMHPDNLGETSPNEKEQAGIALQGLARISLQFYAKDPLLARSYEIHHQVLSQSKSRFKCPSLKSGSGSFPSSGWLLLIPLYTIYMSYALQN